MATLLERMRRARELYDRERDPAKKGQIGQLLEQLLTLRQENPLLFFEPHPAKDGRRPQLEFIQARTKVVAAFAGNQFGKSTVLAACALRECLPNDLLPELLQSTRRYDPPVYGWLMCPTEDKIFDSFQPAFEEWCPKAGFKGGSWGKAFNGSRMELRFSNGSAIQFKTYKQDHSTLGGARCHFVAYDEPPPRGHREEGRMRLVRYGGHEMFAMTPLDANTLYVRRSIWKNREAPHITVVRGSIHDNPTLSKETVALALGDLTDIWRQAREFGDFVDLGGMIYPEWSRCVIHAGTDVPKVKNRDGMWEFDLEFVRTLDIVVGIDPGIRNAGFAWVGFDKDLTAYVFNEGLLQGAEADDYAKFIHSENRRLSLPPSRIQYVSDPMQRERGKVDSTTVKTALAKNGIYANDGQNNQQVGFDQIRSRQAHGRFFVAQSCVGLNDEADDYTGKVPGENDDDSHLEPVNNQFHRLDALRYAVMERFWDPAMDAAPALRNLGFDPARAMPSEHFRRAPEPGHPMGSMF